MPVFLPSATLFFGSPSQTCLQSLGSHRVRIGVGGDDEDIALGEQVFFGGTDNEIEVSYDISINKFTLFQNIFFPLLKFLFVSPNNFL